MQHPCFGFVKGAEPRRCQPGWVPALMGLSSLAAPAPAGEVLALSHCLRVIPVPQLPADQTCLPHKLLIP